MKSLLAQFGKILSSLLQRIPAPLSWGVARLLAFLIFDVFRFRRKVILANINVVFPNLIQSAKIKLGRESMARLFYSLYEFCLFPVIDDRWISENVEFRGLENLTEAYSKDRGVLLLSLHLGHGDLAISMLAHKGFPLYVISKHFKSKWLNDFWFGTRQRFGAHFIDPHGRQTSFDILKALKNKGGVIFVLDQYMGPPYGLETTFFGVKTGTAYGLSLFASKTKAPVIPVWAYRDERGKTIIEAGREVPLVEKDSREETLLATTQNYNSVLEELIRQQPQDWMWLHRRWKKFIFDHPSEDKSKNLAI